MEWLPDEILMQIFSSLDQHTILKTVACVCKRWNRISKDKWLLKCLSLNRTRINRGWNDIFNRYNKIENLILKDFDLYLPNPLDSLTRLPRLFSIELHYCLLCNIFIKRIFEPILNEGFPCITSITFKCGNNYPYISQISDLNSLKSLNIKYDYTIFPIDFSTALKSRPNIENLRLNISNFILSDSSFINSIFRLRCDTLQRVELVCGCIDDSFENLSDCRSLKCLKVFDKFPKVTDLTLSRIMNLNSLTELCLSCCFRFTSSGIDSMFLDGKLNNLNHLEIWGCNDLNDENLRSIANCCKKLTFLSLICCAQVTDKGLKYFVKNCSTLVELDVRECFVVDGSYVHEIFIDNLISLKILCLDTKFDTIEISNLNRLRPRFKLIFLDENHTRFYIDPTNLNEEVRIRHTNFLEEVGIL